MVLIKRDLDGIALYPIHTLAAPIGLPACIVPEDELADALAALLDDPDTFAMDWDTMALASRLAVEAA
jgi:hypothetical protein